VAHKKGHISVQVYQGLDVRAESRSFLLPFAELEIVSLYSGVFSTSISVGLRYCAGRRAKTVFR
jgi:hypothetical protein